MTDTTQTTFDYIIIGGGSAGATLASRLSESGKHQVCLLEAGGKDRNPLIHIPFGLSLIARIDNIGWGYDTVAQTQMNDRKLFWPRGKTMGGSSSINAMCYIRGDQKDYDNWAAQGATGWDWQSVLPYFKRSEDQQHGEDELHGVGGPLGVSDLRHTDPLSKTFVEAADAVGMPILDDFNREDRVGLGFYQVTQKNGQRCSAAKGYIKPALSRTNLTVLTRAMVEKVIIEGDVATGVQARVNGQLLKFSAKREVIVSGGAINSPQVLMLSGIGDKDELAEQGIASKVHLPGVGKNLQDHLDAIVQHRTPVREGYAVALSALPKYIKASFQYLFNRQGLLSSNIAEAGGFAKTQYANGLADIQYHFLPAILNDHGRQTSFGYGFGVHVCCLYPKSRGDIRLQSNNPADAPLINPNYLSDEQDQKVMIDGVRKAREILSAPNFNDYGSNEVSPGANVQSDEAILAFIREKAETIYHPVGTCKMGQVEDEMTVVDPQLKVKGVQNLRVVDASVMPTLIGGNTNAPTIMIAEKAADMILAQQ